MCYGEEKQARFLELCKKRRRARSDASKVVLLEQINDELDLYLTWLEMDQPN